MVRIIVGSPLHGVGVDDIRRDLKGDDGAAGDRGTPATLLMTSEFLIIDLKPHLDQRWTPDFLPLSLPGQREAGPTKAVLIATVVSESLSLDLPRHSRTMSEMPKVNHHRSCTIPLHGLSPGAAFFDI
jgi:hypothetical protein